MYLTLNSLIKYARLQSALAEIELKIILQCLLVESHRSICQGGLNVIAILVQDIL